MRLGNAPAPSSGSQNAPSHAHYTLIDNAQKAQSVRSTTPTEEPLSSLLLASRARGLVLRSHRVDIAWGRIPNKPVPSLEALASSPSPPQTKATRHSHLGVATRRPRGPVCSFEVSLSEQIAARGWRSGRTGVPAPRCRCCSFLSCCRGFTTLR